MGKIAIIYKSKYGHTKTYAQWIAEELGADCLDASKTKGADLERYAAIIYGGGLYAGGVNGIALLTKNFSAIKNKALYLFTVGAADVTDSQNTDSIRRSLDKVLSPEMKEAMKIYHFRGGIDYQRLTMVHRTMMGMLVSGLKKKPEEELREEDRLMLETYGQTVDFTDRTSISGLVNEVKNDIVKHSEG